MKKLQLTNKQMDIVVHMIYEKVRASEEAANKKLSEAAAKEFKPIIFKSKMYKKLATAFTDCDFINSIYIKDKEVTKEFPFYKSEYSHYNRESSTNYESIEHFVKCITNSYVSSKLKKLTERNSIEEKVILSMVDAQDLNELISIITKQFIS